MTNIIALPKTDTVSEVELIYRPTQKPMDRTRIVTSHEAYQAFLKTWDMDKIEMQEQFRVMMLDRRGGCIGIHTHSTGGITSCVIDLRLVFAAAIKSTATQLIVAHNHPSGNLKPSTADITLTQKFQAAGEILDLPVIDHLIITPEGYTSFRDDGYPMKRD